MIIFIHDLIETIRLYLNEMTKKQCLHANVNFVKIGNGKAEIRVICNKCKKELSIKEYKNLEFKQAYSNNNIDVTPNREIRRKIKKNGEKKDDKI